MPPDWEKIASTTDIKFAILAVTERSKADDSFEYNYTEAARVGMKLGAYKYSYAENVHMSKKEAEKVVSGLNGRPLDLPIFLDLEWEWMIDNLSKGAMNNIIEAFREVVEAAGYKFGIYCNLDWYRNHIPEEAKKYPMWVASPPFDDYGQMVPSLKPDVPNLVCWQYSFNKSIPGCASGVDADIWYGEELSPLEPEPIKNPDYIHYDTLHLGSIGSDVRKLQKALKKNGEYVEVDGVFGPQTLHAVINYQSTHGLNPDGIVGPLTWTKLLKPSTTKIAKWVLGDMFGTGEERKNLLTQAGYDYDEVQEEVNKLLE